MAKVFMDMAPFTTKSNGVICIFLLFNYLIKKNLNVFYVPRDIRNMGFPNLGSLPFNASDSLICVNFKKEADDADARDRGVGIDTEKESKITVLFHLTKETKEEKKKSLAVTS